MRRGMGAFALIFVGQCVSITGTSLAQFALTLWAWQFVTVIQPTADPATAMALVAFFNFLPAVLLSPVAGAIVDRANRKLMMMVSDFGAGAATIAIFLLYNAGQLEIGHLYLAGAVTGAFQSFQFPATSAALSMMIPKEQYARAHAMLGLAETAPTIFAPLIAPALLLAIGLHGILLIDIISFSAAVGSLLFIHVPQPVPSVEHGQARPTFWSEMTFGFRYIFQRRSLLGLQLVFFVGNFFASLALGLLAPMILARSGNHERTYGIVQAMAGIGAVLGGIGISLWGGFKRRRVYGVLVGWTLFGVFSLLQQLLYPADQRL
ncbi:MAG: hypothetical protein OHK0023_00610 [Anaerolineae bacterium]